jgi:Uma2 family endonuclease
MERGLEPDECFWIKNASKVWGKRINYETDPPPDLILEVDVTASSMIRIGVYEAMGVPEVWHWDNGQLEFLILDEKGKYSSQPKSRTFPGLSAVDLPPFLEMGYNGDEVVMVDAFREWIQTRIRQGWPDSGKGTGSPSAKKSKTTKKKRKQ